MNAYIGKLIIVNFQTFLTQLFNVHFEKKSLKRLIKLMTLQCMHRDKALILKC